MVIVNKIDIPEKNKNLNSSTYYKIKNSGYFLENNEFKKIGDLLKEYNSLEYLSENIGNQDFLLEDNFIYKELSSGEKFFKKQEIKNSLAQEFEKVLNLDEKDIDILIFCILNNLDFPFYEKILELSKKDFRIIGKTKDELIKLENNTETFFLNSKGEEVFQKEEIEKEKNYFLEKIDGILNNINKQDLFFPFIAFLFLKYLNG